MQPVKTYKWKHGGLVHDGWFLKIDGILYWVALNDMVRVPKCEAVI